MHSRILNEIRKTKPLIHCITNYVTANDCANMLLASGAKPIMADAPQESAEITASAAALYLNLGTLSAERLTAMLASGKAANAAGIPVVLDPVGAGASAFRREAVQRIMHEIRLTVIRGNRSEIAFLTDHHAHNTGVDASEEDTQTDMVKQAKKLAQTTGAVIAVSGETDLVTDGCRTAYIRSGAPIMKQITGAGCMLSALTAAYCTADDAWEAASAAVCAIGIAGQLAAAKLQPYEGNATCRNYLIDAIYRLTESQFEEYADYDIITD